MNAMKYKLSALLNNNEYKKGLEKANNIEEKAFLKTTKHFY